MATVPAGRYNGGGVSTVGGVSSLTEDDDDEEAAGECAGAPRADECGGGGGGAGRVVRWVLSTAGEEVPATHGVEVDTVSVVRGVVDAAAVRKTRENALFNEAACNDRIRLVGLQSQYS